MWETSNSCSAHPAYSMTNGLEISWSGDNFKFYLFSIFKRIERGYSYNLFVKYSSIIAELSISSMPPTNLVIVPIYKDSSSYKTA